MTAQLRQYADHQISALAMMDGNERLGLFFDPGTGKTATALKWTMDAMSSGLAEDAIVICPAAIVPVWEKGIEDMILFEGTTPEQVQMLRDRVHISSYQKIYRTTKHTVQHRNGKESNKKIIRLRDEVDKHWSIMIVDESHRIGVHSSIQTKMCIELSQLCDYRYILSGTPVSGGKGVEAYDKLYGQLQVLTQGRLWKNWTEFKEKMVISFDPWGNPYRYKVDECKRLMQEYAIVARLEDCFDMPDKIDVEIQCDLAEKTIYKDIKEGRFRQYDLDLRTTGSQYPKLMQLCGGSMITETGIKTFKTSKEAALKEIIEGTDDKVVIFALYKASVDRCAEICRKLGKKTVTFDGRSKEPTWKEFQYGDAEICVCQYYRGGEGIDLFTSHTTVFYEPCFSAKDLTQSIARTYRKGQEHKCLFYYLITKNTVEEKAWKTVRSGTTITKKVFDEWAEGKVW